MVELVEVEDESFESKQTGPDDDDEYYTDTDSEISTDDEDNIADEETFTDRILALRDMIPPTTRSYIANTVDSTTSWVKSGLVFSGKTLWVVSTSALLLGVPWALAFAEEQQMVEFEKENRMREMGGELLASGGNTAGALNAQLGAQQGKPALWPLVLRFSKGSVHRAILFPVLVHALIAAFVVYVNQHINSDFNLPSSIIPSLSIVVGLMLVFRNQTAYSRFWGGRCHINTVTTAIRCLSRQILVLVPGPAAPPALSASMSSIDLMGLPGSRTPKFSSPSTTPKHVLAKNDEFRTIETVKILIAMLYTIKNHLRAEWGVALSPGTSLTEDGQQTDTEEYKDLLPPGLKGYEHRGLGLTLQLATFVEAFIRMGVKNQIAHISRDWFHNAASSSMLGELNTLTSAYGSMEVIRLVPIPVAHLIHHKQTLALFCGILPFAMASEMDWWAVPLTAFVAFTLYGIEGIAQTYEDPFGVAKIDINVDDIVEDARREVEVLLNCWQTQGSSGGIFRNHIGEVPTSEASSEYYSDDPSGQDSSGDTSNNVRFVISDLTQGSKGVVGRTSMLSVVSPGTVKGPTSSDDYFAAEEGNAGGFDLRKESALSPGASPLRNAIGGGYNSTEDSRGKGEVKVAEGGKKLAWSDGG
ncbi:Translocase of outer membrane 22 kDa subunit [Hyphodiscus hymeniophilus]|uniref:Translocase of outer membrane 22 kDa subunit n=1 Tax=Hyphodiscus hymeniophilus TaxID=353542 RepID=A0A9P6VIN8_9HELO|nr:Translocase of outer membrane 22 kDa subunit [Hyphodiscus hymeniophilus]